MRPNKSNEEARFDWIGEVKKRYIKASTSPWLETTFPGHKLRFVETASRLTRSRSELKMVSDMKADPAPKRRIGFV